MATFELTANRQIDNGGGLHIERGQTFSITICQGGITPSNLFNNSRCIESIAFQFKSQGIFAPDNSVVFTKGAWDIKMK